MRYSRKRYLMQIKRILYLSIFLLLFGANLTLAQFFNGPESITYDTLNNRYLISNALNGNIVQISDAGDTTFFDTSLARTLGMTVVDSILYVAASSGIVTYDLTIDQKMTTIPIAGMIELNDITADTSGYLYITDIGLGKIIRMKISDHSHTTIASGINKPNGILFDTQCNRILFCQFIPYALIQEINLDNLSVNTVLASSLFYFDGLAIDGNGDIYVSCWGTNSIYRYGHAFSQPEELISSGHHGPADIFYNLHDNTLAIPNYYSNVVDFLPIFPAGIDEVSDIMPKSVALFQNHPNPFNPETVISYQLSGVSNVELIIYNSLGKEVKTLVRQQQVAGEYSIGWNGRDNYDNIVSSGIYYYRILIENNTISKKMILIR